MEIVGYEVDEAGSPLALDNGWFTQSKINPIILDNLLKNYSNQNGARPIIKTALQTEKAI